MGLDKIQDAIIRIEPASRAIYKDALRHLDNLTKPPGSLGYLEEMAARYAAATGSLPPVFKKSRVYTFAADHGVADEGVSAFPREVTRQMVLNFLARGAAINVLAAHAGAEQIVVDVGVDHDFGGVEGLVVRKVRSGTANMAKGPAMSHEEGLASVLVGIEMAEDSFASGVDAVVPGEMGIANTTAASALICCFTGRDPAEIAGFGTGITEEGLAHKVRVIREALKANRPVPKDPLDALAKVGGLEIGAMAGLILGAAANRMVSMVDGFISTAAALIAVNLKPEVKDYIFLAHLSHERGHKDAVAALGVRPIFDLGMRLGEGTGGALALLVLEASVKIFNEMATFESAGVSEKS